MPTKKVITTYTKRKPKTSYSTRKTYTNGTKKNQVTSGYSGIELKFFDTESDFRMMGLNQWLPLTITAPLLPPPLCLSCPGTGSGESQHLGRTFYIKSIFVRGMVRKESFIADPNPVLPVNARVQLVLDKQTNATAMVASDVMQSGPSLLMTYLDYRNLSNAHRYQILGDTGNIPFNVNNTCDGGIGIAATFNAAEVRIPFKFAKTFNPPIKVRTEATDASVSSIADFSIMIIGTTDGLNVDCEWKCRMRYSEQP